MLSFFDNVAFEALPYTFLALGLVLTFRYLRVIDLTFAASFAVAPSIAGALLVQGVPFTVALAAGLGATVALALLTLLLIWLLNLDALLAGLLTSFAGFSVALLFTQGSLSIRGAATPIDPIRAFDLKWLEDGLPLHPAQIVSMFVLVIVAKLAMDWFLRSEMGLAFRAMEDERSRRTLLPSIGVSYWRVLGGGLVAGNLLASVSGLLIMFKEGQVTANRGFDALLATIAAYLFGLLLFEKRAGRPSRQTFLGSLIAPLAQFSATTAAILGVFFYFLLLTLVARLAVPSSTPKLMMVGLVILAFVASRWNDIRARLAKPAGEQVLSEDAVFRADNVTVEYPGYPTPNVVLRNASISIAPGEAVLLVGANGSGKSTLLKFLAGRIDGEGNIEIPAGRPRPRTQLIGYVSQEAHLGLATTLTVAENLAMFHRDGSARLSRRWRPPAEDSTPSPMRELVAAMERPASLLSGGQRQVLSISAMLVRRDAPRIVLFDEPLTHLDEHNAMACVVLMEDLLRQRRSILVVQHDVTLGQEYPTSAARSRLARLLTRTLDIERSTGEQDAR